MYLHAKKPTKQSNSATNPTIKEYKIIMIGFTEQRLVKPTTNASMLTDIPRIIYIAFLISKTSSVSSF